MEGWGRGIMGRAPMEVLSGRVPTSETEEEAVERDLPRKSREAGEREKGDYSMGEKSNLILEEREEAVSTSEWHRSEAIHV